MYVLKTFISLSVGFLKRRLILFIVVDSFIINIIIISQFYYFKSVQVIIVILYFCFCWFILIGITLVGCSLDVTTLLMGVTVFLIRCRDGIVSLPFLNRCCTSMTLSYPKPSCRASWFYVLKTLLWA